MAEEHTETTLIECPLSFTLQDAAGTDIGKGEAASRLTDEALSVLPEVGDSLRFDFRDILGLTAANYAISLELTSRERLTLSQLGYKYEDFLRILVARRNAVILEDMLVGESLRGPGVRAHFTFRGGGDAETQEGDCEVRVYETSLAVLPDFSDPLRVTLSEIASVRPGDHVVEIGGESGETLSLSQMGGGFSVFNKILSGAINNLSQKTQAYLKELFPDLDPTAIRSLAALMKDGRAAVKSRVVAVAPEAWAKLEKRLDAFGGREEYAYLASLAREDEICIGVKRGLLGDLTGEYLWFLVPIHSTEPGKPGNAVAMESVSSGGEGRATYFFRMMGRKEYATARDGESLRREAAKVAATINRCMSDINFRREPVYLPDERLLEPQYRKYYFSTRRLPSLRVLRDLFIGRVVHASPPQWREDVMDLLRFNVEAPHDAAKWTRGG